jgi:hypothetical protein
MLRTTALTRSSLPAPRHLSRHDNKSIRNWTVLIHHYRANFRQFNLLSGNRIRRKLRKPEKTILTDFFKPREFMTSSLKSFPSIVHSFYYVLRHWRMNFLQIRIFFLPLGQLPFWLHIVREWKVRRHDIFPIQRARRQRTFPTVNPVFEVAQTSVIQSPARLQPLKHYRLLVSIWINSVAIVHRQHLSILSESLPNAKTWRNYPEYLLVSSSTLSWILSYTDLHPHVLPNCGGIG